MLTFSSLAVFIFGVALTVRLWTQTKFLFSSNEGPPESAYKSVLDPVVKLVTGMFVLGTTTVGSFIVSDGVVPVDPQELTALVFVFFAALGLTSVATIVINLVSSSPEREDQKFE